VGYTSADFWPGALKSVTWDGTGYGIPTNNETMALIWNAKTSSSEAGLDPESPPATWDDVVAYSKQIHDTLGISGYGLVAKQNAGNTPFRFMPHALGLWRRRARRSGGHAEYQDVWINNEGSQAALQAILRHVRARPVGADLGAHQHPGREPGAVHRGPARHDDRAPVGIRQDARPRQQGDGRGQGGGRRGRGEHALRADPEGPDRRAVVFGGSNIHTVKPEYVDGGYDEMAVKALICMWTSPEWS
jgi:multiple sugar transport system substrate-binding protein